MYFWVHIYHMDDKAKSHVEACFSTQWKRIPMKESPLGQVLASSAGTRCKAMREVIQIHAGSPLIEEGGYQQGANSVEYAPQVMDSGSEPRPTQVRLDQRESIAPRNSDVAALLPHLRCLAPARRESQASVWTAHQCRSLHHLMPVRQCRFLCHPYDGPSRDGRLPGDDKVRRR